MVGSIPQSLDSHSGLGRYIAGLAMPLKFKRSSRDGQAAAYLVELALAITPRLAVQSCKILSYVGVSASRERKGPMPGLITPRTGNRNNSPFLPQGDRLGSGAW